MDIKALCELLEQNGIVLTSRWDLTGKSYEGNYQDVKFRFRGGTSKRQTFRGIKIQFFYSRPIHLGLFCGVNLSPYRDWDEYKPLFSKKIPSPFNAMKCWAKKEEIVRRILDEPMIQKHLTEIFQVLGFSEKGRSAFQQFFFPSNYFILHDKGISMFIHSNESVDFLALLNRSVELIQQIEKFLLPYGESVYEEIRAEKVFRIF